MISNAKLLVISAPSGCGKGTLLSEVFKEKKVYYSISCTTRNPRENEQDGVHYSFIDDKTFEDMISKNQFLEHAGFVGHYYGTPLNPVIENLKNGVDVVLEIETQGAFQVKEAMPEAILIFILPPSIEEIERRLKKRGTEKEEVIAKRVSEAKGEIEKSYHYDYVIMNDALEDAVNDFLTILESVKNENKKADKFKSENEEIKKMIDEVLKNA